MLTDVKKYVIQGEVPFSNRLPSQEAIWSTKLPNLYSRSQSFLYNSIIQQLYQMVIQIIVTFSRRSNLVDLSQSRVVLSMQKALAAVVVTMNLISYLNLRLQSIVKRGSLDLSITTSLQNNQQYIKIIWLRTTSQLIFLTQPSIYQPISRFNS